MTERTQSSAPPTLTATSEVAGAPVFGPGGEKLGSIKDVYLDKRTGQAEFVSIAVGGVLGVGEKCYPAPWAALRADAERGGFSIGVDQAVLEAGPGLPDAGADDATWRRQVHDYHATSSSPGTVVGEKRHFTHGTSASTADMAVDAQVRHEDKSIHTPHARQIDPPEPGEKVDQLAAKVERAESRQEALIDEGVEESFPASDPPSVKRIT
jgi:hypothetical protein